MPDIVNIEKVMVNMAIELVDLPIKNMEMFHIVMLVYGKSPRTKNGKSTICIWAIFNSYVKLPEGNHQRWGHESTTMDIHSNIMNQRFPCKSACDDKNHQG